jgi:hypothetical protein
MFIYCCEICGEKFESTTTLEQAVQAVSAAVSWRSL